jgi:hypothetical protein
MELAEAPVDVDLALILAVDCSSSVDAGDFRLQMQGIASALRHPLLPAAIGGGPNARIAIALVQWSTRDSQAIVLPWRLLASPADIEAAARNIENLDRHWRPGGTGLAAAIAFCASLLGNLPFRALRRAVDVSGDGEDNEGGDAALARDAVVALGVSISGLPIIDGSQRLEDYYRRNVIGGPGSFLMPAKNLLDFTDAMIRKLLREVGHATV